MTIARQRPSCALFPSADATLDSGASGNRWSRTFTNVLAITAGVSAPAAIAGYVVLYVDSADGDLKVIFPDGTVKTIVTDN